MTVKKIWKYWTYVFIITLNMLCWLFLIALFMAYPQVVAVSAVCGFIVMTSIIYIINMIKWK